MSRPATARWRRPRCLISFCPRVCHRCQEGYGEDPWLTALLGEQYVSGLQYGSDPNHLKVLAGCKHFDVHTGPENSNVGWTTGPLGTPPHVAANQTCAQPGMLPNDGHGVYIGPNGGPGTYVQNDTGGCRWSFDARVSAQDWIETFPLPFKKCVAAGARSLMCSCESPWGRSCLISHSLCVHSTVQ